MSVNRIRNKIKFTSFSNLSEIALKEVLYRWSSANGGVEVIIYNVAVPRGRRKSVPIINILSEGVSLPYLYSWLQRDHGIEFDNNRVIIDGVDFV